jgi:hypothetical protein
VPAEVVDYHAEQLGIADAVLMELPRPVRAGDLSAAAAVVTFAGLAVSSCHPKQADR